MATLVDLPIAALNAADHRADLARVAVIVPTCNAGPHWSAFSAALRSQAIPPGQVLLVDSTSDDGTYELAEAEGFQVHRIERREFNHGGTRQMALGMVPWADIVVYLTQDAVLATPDAITQLLAAFEDPAVAAAYGRQLPRPGAGPIETHARLFNYPQQSDVRDYESRHRLGIKATFMSNSFAAYRIERLVDVGGFPSNTILSEDAIVAGKLLLAGWKTAYVAEAEVYHSHRFTAAQEFRRYFDIGTLHAREKWLMLEFGLPNGEGKRFVQSELRHLARHDPWAIPSSCLRTLCKGAGYALGKRESRLPQRLKAALAMNRSYWIHSNQP